MTAQPRSSKGFLGSVVAVMLGLFLQLGTISAQPGIPVNFPVSVPDSFTTFDQSFLYLTTIAAQLSVDVMKTDPAAALTNIPGGLLYEDGPDRKALLGYRNGVCYAAFADYEEVTEVSDVFPSVIDSVTAFDTCGLESCCPTTKAVKNDLEASYHFTLMETVRNCANNCAGGCPVALTGFGRGGAVA